MSWLSQYFLNPGFVLPGAALACVPIIIHLLSRLRYKKVRFAAMEFLLQSDELNRRRLIIEQLLLLFMRVLAVVLLVILLARLVLSPSGMLLMRGATTHHVLILDDTLSMRAVDGDRTLFQSAVDTLKTMTSQNGLRTGSQRVTVMTMTEPDRPLVMDRALDGALIQELGPRLSNLQCSFRNASPVDSLEAALNILTSNSGVAPQVHIITDFRRTDWQNRPDVSEAFEELGDIETSISVVQVGRDSVDNIEISDMSADNLSVASGIPWRINLTFKNHGSQQSSGLRADVIVNGSALPVKVLVPDIEAGESVKLSHDITLEAPGLHAVEVRLEEDALKEDNSRFLAVDVTNERKVLIVDDESRQEDARFLSLAISDPELTGVAAEVRVSDVLTATPLDDYDCIYLLNIRELPADAVEMLKQYVIRGGGVAWFPDGQANTTWYNDLASGTSPLFPVLLTTIRTEPDSSPDDTSNEAVPTFQKHPIFLAYNDPDSPLADALRFRQWFRTDQDQLKERVDAGEVEILCHMNNGDPIIFEQKLDAGHIIAFLTSAGRRWTNWPVADSPGYVVMHMLLTQYLQKPSLSVEVREIDETLSFAWPVSRFTDAMDVFLPESPEASEEEDIFLRLQAAPEQKENVDRPSVSPSDEEERLTISLPQADRPGVYRIRRYRLDGESVEQRLAMNVTTAESDLTVALAAEVEQQSDSGLISVVPAGNSNELTGSDAGRELRWILIGLLLVVLVCEQMLSLRLSFHPEVKA